MKKNCLFLLLVLCLVSMNQANAQTYKNAQKRLERIQSGFDPSTRCAGKTVRTCDGIKKFPRGPLFDECCVLLWLNGKEPNDKIKVGEVFLLLDGTLDTLDQQQAQNGVCCLIQDQWYKEGKIDTPCPPNAGLCDVTPLPRRGDSLDIPKPKILAPTPCICDTIRDTITIVKDTIIRDTLKLPCNECDTIHQKFMEHKGVFVYGNVSLSALRHEGKQEILDFGKPVFGVGLGYQLPLKKRLAPCIGQSLRFQLGLMSTHRQYVPDACGCNNVPAVANIGYEAQALYQVHLIRNWPWDFALGIGPTASYTKVTSEDEAIKKKLEAFAWNIVVEPEIARHFNNLEVAVAVSLPLLRNQERHFGANLTLRYLIKGKKKAETPKAVVQPMDTINTDTLQIDTLETDTLELDTLNNEIPPTDTLQRVIPQRDTLNNEIPQSEVPQNEVPESDTPQTEELRIEGEKAEGIKPEGQKA
jgi:hypothetical protein